MNYSKGKIYTIRCKTDPTLIYVGSTKQPLSHRLGNHKADAKRHPNIYLYSQINSEWENWYIELYEDFPCENKEQLLKREGEIIRLIGTLNTRFEDRNWTMNEYQKDYYQKYKTETQHRHKEYYQQNKEKIAENRVKNSQKNIEYQKIYRLKKKEEPVI